MKKIILFLFIIYSLNGDAQFKRRAADLAWGPMIGHVELRSAVISMEFLKPNPGAEFWYQQHSGDKPMISKKATLVFEPNSSTARVTLTELEPGTKYEYRVMLNERQVASGEVTTQQLWQYRKPAPNFSFLAGSCTYFNEPVYDRPGKPYGGDSSIFDAMGKENADFMLWLGDNWYTREVDFFSESGLEYRAAHFRKQKVLQPLFKKMAQYAIWDDHDYGWNNSDKSYPLKEKSREVFMKTWSNPSYGENAEGIYTKFTWNDIDVFLLDDRWFRTNDDMPDSIDGKPAQKEMFGAKQMEWLKNALLQSNYNRNISFRLIVTGSQVMNPLSPLDKFASYKNEYDDFISFLKASKINGVVFLTGDRHHSEITKVDGLVGYPLYDITSSPLTSGISRITEAEKNSPYRVLEPINLQNYSRFSFSGEKENRKMMVEFLGIKGEKLGEWSIALRDISVPK